MHPAVDTRFFAVQSLVSGAAAGRAGGGSMEYAKALDQISEIHQHLARTEIYRGYRSVPVALSGAVGVLAAVGPALVPLLPGLWAMLFGVAAFGARPYLPRATGWVALYYMTAGAWLLWHAGGAPPSAWAVGGTFGAGQLASAAVLYWNLERR